MEDQDLMPPIDWVESKSSIIKVIGVGGGGSNAVNHMYQLGIHNVSFAVCNTDWQDLQKSPVPVKIKIGELGAGGAPEVGRKAAMEHLEKIRELLDTGTKMVFVTAGMGGGTGTGATPVIARIAKEMGILTVAIVTIPFGYEGEKRFKQAIEGITELKDHVDALLVINNDKLFEIYGDLTLSESFAMADNVLNLAAKGIAELITRTGKVNLDFADVSSIMSGGGISVIGSASASGENRAREAAEKALTSPLLNNNDITGARRILLNITSGSGEYDLKTSEFQEITSYVTRIAKNATMIWGAGNDDSLGDAVSVTVVATDFFDNGCIDPALEITETKAPEKVVLNNDNLDDNPKNMHEKATGGGPMKFVVKDRTPPTTVKPEITRSTYTSTVVKTEAQTDADVDVDVDVEVLDEQPAVKQKPIPVIVDERYSVDDIERIPAFKRRDVKLDNNNIPAIEKEVSKFTLGSDKENTVRLRDNNAYLYNRAD